MKKFAWTFDVGNDTLSGDADTREEAAQAMEAIGYIAGEMEGTIVERSDEEMVSHARALASKPKSVSSLAHLAKANDTMFKQVDALKNLVSELEQKLSAALFDRRLFHVGLIDAQMCVEGIRDMVLAWNTDQHARLGAAHREPAFVELLREYTGFKALKKREGKNEEAKVQEEVRA